MYLVRYAEEQQDVALLSISTFQKALKDPNQLIRASALRVLSSIRVPIIAPIMMLSIKDVSWWLWCMYKLHVHCTSVCTQSTCKSILHTCSCKCHSPSLSLLSSPLSLSLSLPPSLFPPLSSLPLFFPSCPFHPSFSLPVCNGHVSLCS